MPSLYIHVPFCLKKCDYCAFYSVPTARSPSNMISNYLVGLEREIELVQEEFGKEKEPITTVFVGGGTPTLLQQAELELFLKTLAHGFALGNAGYERTVEGNPGTLTLEKLQLLRNYSFNRISLGAQSLQDDQLKKIGRIHTVEDIRKGVKLVRQAGFQNLNLDFMFGLPDQTLTDWQETLETAINLNPEHLSVYGLMIEENTPLHKNIQHYHIPDDDLQAEMYEQASKILEDAGYIHYETSNFAKPGFECKHNLGYWQGDEYYGLGPSAVSFISNRRWKNFENLALYMEKVNHGETPMDPEEDEAVTREMRMSERIILGLRLKQGLNLKEFEKEFEVNLLDKYASVVERYTKNGVLTVQEGNLKIKNKYWFVANAILQEFV